MIVRYKKNGSIELVYATVTAASSLDGTTVEISVTPHGGAHDWQAADWDGTPTTTGTAVTSAVHTYATGNYIVNVRVTSGSQIPIIECYAVKVYP